jgi:plasmid stabilization system protein ParE
MKIRYTALAFAEREAIFEYINERSPLGAVAIKRAIERAIRRLERYPYSAPATDEPRIHELIVPPTPLQNLLPRRR